MIFKLLVLMTKASIIKVIIATLVVKKLPELFMGKAIEQRVKNGGANITLFKGHLFCLNKS